MTITALILLAAFACSVAPLDAQQAAPAYDVVSIRPNNTGGGHVGVHGTDTEIRTDNTSLRVLLETATGVRKNQIYGLPKWAESAGFDLMAKVLDADPKALKDMTDKQRGAMLLVVLENRFGVKFHHEMKVLPVYDLVVAKDGTKLVPLPESALVADPDGTGPQPGSINTHNANMQVTAAPLGEVLQDLENEVDRPMIDKTGLTGNYTFTLKWTRENQAAAGTDNGQTDAPPTIFVALQEQLGLKLVPSKGPVDTIVIDEVKMPTAN